MFDKYRMPVYADGGLLMAFWMRGHTASDFLQALSSALRRESFLLFVLYHERVAVAAVEGYSEEKSASLTSLLGRDARLSPYLRWPAAIYGRALTRKTLLSALKAVLSVVERRYLFDASEPFVAAPAQEGRPVPQAELAKVYQAFLQGAQAMNGAALAAAGVAFAALVAEYRPSHDQLSGMVSVILALLGSEQAPDALLGGRYTIKSVAQALAQGEEGKLAMPEDDLMRKALSYAQAHLTERLSTDQMARQTNLSVGHFCRRFKEYAGTSFIDWMHHARIDKAKALLTNPQLKHFEIASMVGYADYKTFAKYFLRYTGMSVRRYKQP